MLAFSIAGYVPFKYTMNQELTERMQHEETEDYRGIISHMLNGNCSVNTKGCGKTRGWKIQRKTGEFKMKHILIIDDDIHIGNVIE